MRVIAVIAVLLLTMLVILVSVWRIDVIREREDELWEEVDAIRLDWTFEYSIEVSLLTLLFLGEDAVDPAAPRAEEQFRRRIDFWRSRALYPDLLRGVTSFTEDGVARLSLPDGNVEWLDDGPPTPDEIPRDYEFFFFDLPITLLDGRPDRPIAAAWSGSRLDVLHLDPAILTTALPNTLMERVVGPDDGRGEWWDFALRWTSSEDTVEEWTDSEIRAVLSLFSPPWEEEAPSFPRDVPESLRGDEDLATLLALRSHRYEWIDAEPTSFLPDTVLTASIDFDRTRMLLVAARGELGEMFLMYAGLILLIVVVMNLIAYNRRAHRQIEEHTRFVASVTHELRTPLSVICNAGANIADGLIVDAEDLTRYGELITGEGRRLDRMVESVLLYSGFLSGREHKERVDLSELLRPLLETTDFLCAQKGIRFEKEIEEGLSILADPEGVRSAISNLIHNGITHGGAGKFLRLVVRSHDGSLVVSVRDRGPGIDEAERTRIFQPFYRGKKQTHGGGSGIGLGLVGMVAEAHGGTVHVESRPGEGALFTLRIPLEEGAS